jgi:AhpD family alkylhydroperoxidase
VAADEQRLTEAQWELIAIGASVGTGCQPCLSYHLQAGKKAGLSPESLLAGVVTAECAAAESAERLTDHARVVIGDRVSELKATTRLDQTLASLGGALGSNDMTNVRHQLIAAQHLGISRSELRGAIELARTVQENSTRMHFRTALDLLSPISTGGGQPDEATPQDAPAGGGASSGAPNFVSMIARLLTLIDSCDSTQLQAKMDQCFEVFESNCCQPGQPTATEEQPAATSAQPTNTSVCDCAAMRFGRPVSPSDPECGCPPEGASTSANGPTSPSR